jgi:hypothetical protein
VVGLVPKKSAKVGLLFALSHPFCMFFAELHIELNKKQAPPGAANF